MCARDIQSLILNACRCLTGWKMMVQIHSYDAQFLPYRKVHMLGSNATLHGLLGEDSDGHGALQKIIIYKIDKSLLHAVSPPKHIC